MTYAQKFRAWATARHFAQLGVISLLLASIRIPAEFLRLGGGVPADKMMLAAIVASSFCFLATLLHFFARDRLSIAATVVGIVALVIYKFWQLPQLS